MEQLPLEALTEIMLLLPYHDLIEYCRTHKYTQQLCNDNSFWRQKYLNDYGEPKPAPIRSWRQTYETELAKQPRVYVVYQMEGNMIGWTNLLDNAKDAKDAVVAQMIKAQPPQDIPSVGYQPQPEFIGCWHAVQNLTNSVNFENMAEYVRLSALLNQPLNPDNFARLYPEIQHNCELSIEEWATQYHALHRAILQNLEFIDYIEYGGSVFGILTQLLATSAV